MFVTSVVTPFAGVWIEIFAHLSTICQPVVTPFAGVWIEMIRKDRYTQTRWSLPSRECGLKLSCPYLPLLQKRHSLRGSVD